MAKRAARRLPAVARPRVEEEGVEEPLTDLAVARGIDKWEGCEMRIEEGKGEAVSEGMAGGAGPRNDLLELCVSSKLSGSCSRRT